MYFPSSSCSSTKFSIEMSKIFVSCVYKIKHCFYLSDVIPEISNKSPTHELHPLHDVNKEFIR